MLDKLPSLRLSLYYQEPGSPSVRVISVMLLRIRPLEDQEQSLLRKLSNYVPYLLCQPCACQAKMKTGFFKQAKKSYPMFPCKEEKIKWDEYGEFIK